VPRMCVSLSYLSVFYKKIKQVLY